MLPLFIIIGIDQTYQERINVEIRHIIEVGIGERCKEDGGCE